MSCGVMPMPSWITTTPGCGPAPTGVAVKMGSARSVMGCILAHSTEAGGASTSVLRMQDIGLEETAATGLTAAEVQERTARGQVNDAGERTSRTLSEIIRANVFTRFNAILGAALLAIFVIGGLQDATFGIILVF